MPFPELVLLVVGITFCIAYALWESGADRLLATMGSHILRAFTFGRVRIAADKINGEGAMVAGDVTMIFLFLSLLILAD